MVLYWTLRCWFLLKKMTDKSTRGWLSQRQSRMNSDIVLNLRITGASLDAIVGRALTVGEREVLINSAIGHTIGYEDGMPPFIRAIRDLTEDGGDDTTEAAEEAAREVLEDEFDIPDWVYSDDNHNIQPKAGRLLRLNPIRKEREERDAARKREQERIANHLANYDTTSASWADMPAAKVLEIVDEMDLDGHTIRTLKAYKDAGLPIGLVARHYKRHEEVWDWTAGNEGEYDYCSVKDKATGRTYNRPCVPEFWGVYDMDVLRDISSAFELNPRTALGRGTSARLVVDALREYVRNEPVLAQTVRNVERRVAAFA